MSRSSASSRRCGRQTPAMSAGHIEDVGRTRITMSSKASPSAIRSRVTCGVAAEAPDTDAPPRVTTARRRPPTPRAWIITLPICRIQSRPVADRRGCLSKIAERARRAVPAGFVVLHRPPNSPPFDDPAGRRQTALLILARCHGPRPSTVAARRVGCPLRPRESPEAEQKAPSASRSRGS